MCFVDLLGSRPPPIRRQGSEDALFTLRSALSGAEAAAILQRAEAQGFSPAPITVGPGRFVMAPHIRDNTRLIVDDVALASALWARLGSWLPQRSPRGWLHPRWRAIGLNERFRLYRYAPGQRFRWHRDGAYHRDRDEQSFYSLLLYLNEDFEGGHTSFEGGLGIRPRTGSALVFAHPLLHQGDPVVSGTKYVLRTDVMYRRTERDGA